ncbi:thiol-disulfide isomerase/thioredoxin [Zhongshania antarctica]|uniref:Thiol-disulfide isomerase/thioredoxin n=1 Tax=Zhongshania antarctica TaxID=641702 RepID=A0A840R850_9GAMM|nr:TlpA disulfide reductase family protein [Zhongshania antarctica]MBB5188540.1 thiol-disulfide isomerase/thioredoxin [Zhongshania antarctica]
MTSIGPFSIQTVSVLAAILLAWLVTRTVAKRLPETSHKLAGGVLLDAVFWGVIAARLGYIARWWEDYLAAPMSMISISDGGFSWWVGVLAALAFVWWRTRTLTALRRPVVTGVLISVTAWLAVGAMVGALLQKPLMPDVQLTTLDDQPISLMSYKGRPAVVNLWATWCPPCRREMPVFEWAQAEFPQVAIVMVNQGESAQDVQEFLKSEGLALTDVLLDPFSKTMHAMGAGALPTTLFFDAQGRMVHSHMGESTQASFRSTMSRHFAPSSAQ